MVRSLPRRPGYDAFMRRLFRTLIPGLGLALALSGCLKLDIDGKVGTDGKVDGTMVVGFNSQMMAMLSSMSSLDSTPGKKPQSADDIWKKAVVDAKKTKGVTDAKRYKKNGFDGLQISFKGVSPEQVINLGNDSTNVASTANRNATPSKSKLTIVRKGDNMVLNGVLDMGGGSPGAGAGTDDLTKSMAGAFKASKPELRIKFTFPGNVSKSNGKISGHSVTWTPELGKNLTMTAEAKAS